VNYLQLVDWTGRCIREDKVGLIESTAEPIQSTESFSEIENLELPNTGTGFSEN